MSSRHAFNIVQASFIMLLILLGHVISITALCSSPPQFPSRFRTPPVQTIDFSQCIVLVLCSELSRLAVCLMLSLTNSPHRQGTENCATRAGGPFPQTDYILRVRPSHFIYIDICSPQIDHGRPERTEAVGLRWLALAWDFFVSLFSFSIELCLCVL